MCHNFEWVAIQIRLLLDQTPPLSIRRVLQETPDTICGIFQSATELMRHQCEAREQLVRRALALLAIIATPITAGASCHALGMANVLDFEEGSRELHEGYIPNPDFIAGCYQGLIAIDPVISVVTIPYWEIEQHMQKHWDTLLLPSVKRKLAEMLLAYISMEAFSSCLSCHIDDFSRRLGEYPLMNYASLY